MDWCRLMNSFIQKLGTLSGPGDFQFAVLVTLQPSSVTVYYYYYYLLLLLLLLLLCSTCPNVDTLLPALNNEKKL